MTAEGWLTLAHREFHASLLDGILTRSATGFPSNADKGSRPSVEIANSILEQLGSVQTAPNLPGQTAGSDFEDACASFVRICIERMQHHRPGRYSVAKGGGIAQFDQYAHMDAFEAIARANREITTAIGADYLSTQILSSPGNRSQTTSSTLSGPL